MMSVTLVEGKDTAPLNAQVRRLTKKRVLHRVRHRNCTWFHTWTGEMSSRGSITSRLYRPRRHHLLHKPKPKLKLSGLVVHSSSSSIVSVDFPMRTWDRFITPWKLANLSMHETITSIPSFTPSSHFLRTMRPLRWMSIGIRKKLRSTLTPNTTMTNRYTATLMVHIHMIRPRRFTPQKKLSKMSQMSQMLLSIFR